MSKLPTILRVIGWSMFGLMMVIVLLASMGTVFLKDAFSNVPTFAYVVLIALICVMVVIIFGSLIGASLISRQLKKTAARRGKKVTARIVKTAYMGGEGSGRSASSNWQIIRFDLEVDYEGETVSASTEVKTRNFDASKYPPGTKVSAVYDHSTGTIAMLDKNNTVVEYF